MKRFHILFVITVLAFACGARLMAQTGTISGTLVDGTEKGLAGGEVFYLQHRELVKDQFGKRALNTTPIRQGTVKADPLGRFVINGLPSGGYVVCAVSKRGLTLSSCGWEPTSIQRVVEGKPILDVKLRLYPTTPVTFNVVDPSSRILMPDRFGRIHTPARRFFLGIVSPTGAYLAAKVVASSETNYRLAVDAPIGQKFRLLMDSELNVVTEQGERLLRLTATRLEFDTATLGGRAISLVVQSTEVQDK